MCNSTLNEVFEEIHRCDFAVFDNAPRHLFSNKHRRAMKKILSAASQNAGPSCDTHKLPFGKKAIIICLVIFMAMLGIAAGAAIVNVFKLEKHRDNTEVLTANAENCPQTITDVYHLSKIPDGYELSEQMVNSSWANTTYYNKQTNRYFTFDQSVKIGYDTHFDNEKHHIKELDIDGHNALYVCPDNSEQKSGALIWDNGDFILEIFGDFSEDELIELAKSVVV